MSEPADIAQARFLREWGGFIDAWVNKVGSTRGASSDEADDLRQSAYLRGWTGFVKWQQLPPDQQTNEAAAMIVAREVKDAVSEQWCKLRGVARKSGRQRGAGVRAALLRDSLGQLCRPDGSHVRARLETHSRAIVSYHLLMAGLLHGTTGLVRPDTRLVRAEAKERLFFAIDRLCPEHRELINGVYFHGLSFKQAGERMGIRSSSVLSRMHRDALDHLKHEMAEFASALGARHTAHTLDDDPTSDDAPT